MNIKYRYTQANAVHEGELQRTTGVADPHDVVIAVVQHVANITRETVWFSMLDPTGTTVVGTNHAEPEGVQNTGLRTVKTVDISENGGDSWNSIRVRS